MLVIRLRRVGKKNRPTYRIVVAERRNPVQGSFVEDLGFYNPHTKEISLKKENVLSWLDKGAKPSNTVAKLLSREKIDHRLVVVVRRLKKPKLQADEAPQPASSTPATGEDKAD